MNYLAHALLAGPLATDRVGGVAGDFVKGLLQPCPGWLDPALAEGVRLHRRIDSFADAHPAFRHSRARVSEARKRFGGVLVDMFYDHFLAVHWQRYSPEPLADFTAETYRLIATRLDALPAPFAPVFARMAAHDWLGSYHDPANIALALGCRRRVRAASYMRAYMSICPCSPTPWPGPAKSCCRSTRGWRPTSWLSSPTPWPLRNRCAGRAEGRDVPVWGHPASPGRPSGPAAR